MTAARYALPAALLAFFAFVYTPVWDSDFWWHLASGRWIVEHAAIPATDPFDVYSGADAVRNDTVLRGQWLGQIIFYTLYRAAGEHGVIALRAALLTACLGLVAWRARRLGAPDWATWAILIPGGLIALGFTSDRPQLFSYLCAAVVFALLEQHRHSGSPRALFAIPVIGVVWANTHGGFLLGIALLWLYAAACWRFERSSSSKPLWIVAVAFTFATLLNANGVNTFRYLLDLEGSAVQHATSEYISAFKLYTFGFALPQLWIAVIYLFTLIAAVALMRTRRTMFAIVAALALAGAVYYRYFAFLVFVAGPYLAVGLGLTLHRVSPQFERVRAQANAVLIAVALSALGLGVTNGWALHGGVNDAFAPVKTTEFLRTNRFAGRVFNHMQWGGYLLWELTPQVRVFVDGRLLDRDVFDAYTHMLWATPSGVALLKSGEFDAVALPLTNRFTHERYALHDALAANPEWREVFRSDEGVVYFKNRLRQPHPIDFGQ